MILTAIVAGIFGIILCVAMIIIVIQDYILEKNTTSIIEDNNVHPRKEICHEREHKKHSRSDGEHR